MESLKHKYGKELQTLSESEGERVAAPLLFSNVTFSLQYFFIFYRCVKFILLSAISTFS